MDMLPETQDGVKTPDLISWVLTRCFRVAETSRWRAEARLKALTVTGASRCAAAWSSQAPGKLLCTENLQLPAPRIIIVESSRATAAKRLSFRITPGHVQFICMATLLAVTTASLSMQMQSKVGLHTHESQPQQEAMLRFTAFREVQASLWAPGVTTMKRATFLPSTTLMFCRRTVR